MLNTKYKRALFRIKMGDGKRSTSRPRLAARVLEVFTCILPPSPLLKNTLRSPLVARFIAVYGPEKFKKHVRLTDFSEVRKGRVYARGFGVRSVFIHKLSPTIIK
jgi:hypothetical protein